MDSVGSLLQPLFKPGRERKLKALFICRSPGAGYNCKMLSALKARPMSLMTPLRWLALLGIAVAAGSLWLPLAHSDENDHELARQALQQGKVLPLRTVLDQVERDYQGQVVKVEFEHDDGHFVYELRLLHPNGQLSKLEIDAVTGKVLRLRKKEHD